MEAQTDPVVKRTPGRRGADQLRQKGAWVLVAGALLQGGFLTMSWRLLAIGERQLDRERAILVEQHQELLAALTDLGRRVTALEGRAGELGEAASTVQGMVLGRLRCPAPRPCPPLPPITCPAPNVTVVAPPPERPSGDDKKREAPWMRREP